MSTEIEYERTYLAKELPSNLDKSRSVVIRDIYIPDTVNHACLRLRQKGDSFEITKKMPVSGGDSSVQYEHTIKLDEDEWSALARCSDKSFVKRRYFTKIEGLPAEVDVYGENLTGLVVIDFEFDTEEKKDAFVMPAMCLADVTQEESIAGGYLAGKSYEDLEEFLDKYGYVKILGGERL